MLRFHQKCQRPEKSITRSSLKLKNKILFTACKTALLHVLVLLAVYRASPAAMGADAFSQNISAECAVLISADTGEILYEQQGTVQHSMASTTKIMTALLLLEASEAQGNPVIDITEEMVLVEGSSMGLRGGDRLSLEGIATGMLLASGNDAANAAALYLGGSQEGFAEIMNNRAQEIGMANTHFVTPSGLDDDAHYSTAYDMALLAREAMQNEKFVEIASTKTATVVFETPEKSASYTNHNKLLFQYEGCNGLKTGFTKKSGRCLVSSAERNGITLIAVTLNAPDDWQDHTLLLDYGFSVMTTTTIDQSGLTGAVPVVGGTTEFVSLKSQYGGDLVIKDGDAAKMEHVVNLPRFLYAPVQADEQVGSVDYYIEGRKVYSLPVFAEQAVNYKEKQGFFEKLFG